MAVPYIFKNRRVPQSETDIDADKVNADFASLSDGSAWALGIVHIASLGADVIAAIGGFLMNFLINGSFESFAAGVFNRWVFNNGGDGTATLTQDNTPANVKFGLNSAAILSGVGAATTLSLSQSCQNFSDFAGLQVTLKVWVKPAFIGTMRARIFDGVGSTVSPYNAATGAFEPLIVTRTVTGIPTELTVSIELDQPGAVALSSYIDGAMLVLGPTPIDYLPGLNPLDALAGLGNQMNVVPVEIPNGVITLFTCPGGQTYEPGKIGVYLRGLRMTPTVDYNEVGNNQIQFLGAQIPQTGDTLFFDFIEPLF